MEMLPSTQISTALRSYEGTLCGGVICIIPAANTLSHYLGHWCLPSHKEYEKGSSSIYLGCLSLHVAKLISAIAFLQSSERLQATVSDV